MEKKDIEKGGKSCQGHSLYQPTPEEREYVRRHSQKVIEKYRDSTSGKLGDFIRRCKSSKASEKDGLRNSERFDEVKGVTEQASLGDMERKLCEQLNKSPLFQLSLASKELFHTNFLYWLATTEETKPLFLNFLGKDIVGKLPPEGWDVRREYRHFDLCLTEKPKKNKNKKGKDLHPAILLVIENKVKSIATASQLMGYQSAANAYNGKIKSSNASCQFVLLTLAEFKQSVGSWKVCYYNQLAESLDLQTIDSTKLSDYQKDIIADYKKFIENLHQLSRLWTLKEYPECFPPTDCISLYDHLRLNDLFEKQRFNQMVECLIRKLESIKIKYVRGGDIPKVNNESLSETFLKGYQDSVYIHHDYTRGQGLLDIKIAEPCGKYIVGIQLQGRQYRHYVQYPLPGSKWIFADTLQQPFISKMDFFGDVNGVLLNEEQKVSSDIFFHIKDNQRVGCCKFGDTFFYRYLTVLEEAQVEDVLTLICKDIEWVLSYK